jgi:hypothetical protein
MQVLDNVELGQAGMRDLTVNQLLRNYPNRLPARIQDGVCECTHEPDVAAAVDQDDPAPGKQFPNNAGSIKVSRVVTRSRATEDTDHRCTAYRPGVGSGAVRLRRDRSPGGNGLASGAAAGTLHRAA